MKNARDHRCPNSGKKDWQWFVMSGCPDVLHMFDAQILLRVLPKHAKTIKAHLAPGIRRPAHAELIKGRKSWEASSANMGQKVPGTSNDRFLRSQEGS